jgi:hypothetical protein
MAHSPPPKRASLPARAADARPTHQSGQVPRVKPSGERAPSSADWRSAKEDVLVRLMFTPGSSPLEATHAYLTAYLAERTAPGVAQRVCLAAYELLANATNYATLGSDVVLEIVQRASRVGVRASNNTIPARVAMLRQQLDKIAQSAEEAFLSELKRSATGRPMLGLARIAHEVGLELALETTGERVTVSALPR